MKNADMPINGHLKLVGDVAINAGGLTKREHFAALAMQGMISSSVQDTPENFAKCSVLLADALLAELENKS